jgi:hypothetical protein
MAAPQMIDVGGDVFADVVEVMVGGVAAPVIIGTVGFYLPPIIISFVATPSSGEVVVDLAVPVGAVVTQVNATVTADAPGRTNIGGTATVRASAGEPTSSSTELVVDFGGLRTVSSLQVPGTAAVSKVTPWVGTKFDGDVDLIGTGGWVDFQELQTERLLVTVSQAVSPATMAADGKVTTTTPPADLELMVGATRAWLRPGPAPAGFTETVDVTAAVQAAVDAGTPLDGAGNVMVRLVLRARVPGDIGLDIGAPRYLRTHAVDFPGPTTTVRFAEEGRQPVPLPLPAGHETWLVHQVLATVAAEDTGPRRVLPPIGPAKSTTAELLLDADRRLCVRLPDAALDRLRLVHGIRVLLTPGSTGIELGGSLLDGTPTAPGEPVPDVVLGPVSVPPASEPAWVSLLFGQPVPPLVDGSTWIALSVARGEAVVALAEPAALAAEDALLRRIAPNGVAQVPSTALLERLSVSDPAVAVRTDLLALRVVGEAPDEAPIPLVEVDLEGGAEQGTVSATTISLAFEPPQTRDPLTIQLTATSPTTVTVGPVVVAYTDSGAQP